MRVVPRSGEDGNRLAGVRVQFVDCRWELGAPQRGRELYLAGHVPGASFLDLEADLSDLTVPDAGRHPLPAAARFATAATRAGIGPGVLVVAYGTMGGAERLWWLLRHFGHDDCGVLLGGLEAWGGPLLAGEEEIEPGSSSRRSATTTRSAPPSSSAGSPIPRSCSSMPGRRRAGAASRIRSTTHRGGYPVRSMPPGPSPCPSCPTASSSPTAARASPPASCCTVQRSRAARAGSTPARGASGRSAACRSSEGRPAEPCD